MHKNRNFFNSVKNAMSGIRTVCHDERNFLFELLIGIAAIAACFLLRVSWGELAAVVICCMLVLGAECFNSAIEYIVDLVSPGHSELAKKAKDAAAGAVLIVSLGAVAVGVCIFLPKLWQLFF